MRNIFKLLVLTVMLRVWWGSGFSGIVLSQNGQFVSDCTLAIREDTQPLEKTGDGDIYFSNIACSRINKSKWVNVEADQ